MTSGNIDTVVNWPAPSSKKDVERYLVLENYHRTVVNDFAGLALHLYNLAGKNQFKQGKREQEVLDVLKKL